ncbi:MAG: hypothetical protein H6730_21710 [Deltaproteobacteria bacterium]|nr:hypothetical protein [Deltaproteobacteria bacterium]
MQAADRADSAAQGYLHRLVFASCFEEERKVGVQRWPPRGQQCKSRPR